jgi:hypothetical protein
MRVFGALTQAQPPRTARGAATFKESLDAK